MPAEEEEEEEEEATAGPVQLARTGTPATAQPQQQILPPLIGEEEEVDITQPGQVRALERRAGILAARRGARPQQQRPAPTPAPPTQQQDPEEIELQQFGQAGTQITPQVTPERQGPGALFTTPPTPLTPQQLQQLQQQLGAPTIGALGTSQQPSPQPQPQQQPQAGAAAAAAATPPPPPPPVQAPVQPTPQPIAQAPVPPPPQLAQQPQPLAPALQLQAQRAQARADQPDPADIFGEAIGGIGLEQQVEVDPMPQPVAQRSFGQGSVRDIREAQIAMQEALHEMERAAQLQVTTRAPGAPRPDPTRTQAGMMPDTRPNGGGPMRNGRNGRNGMNGMRGGSRMLEFFMNIGPAQTRQAILRRSIENTGGALGDINRLAAGQVGLATAGLGFAGGALAATRGTLGTFTQQLLGA